MASRPTRLLTHWDARRYFRIARNGHERHAIVLSVFDAGAGNLTVPAARVRILAPLIADTDTYVVPAAFLQPVPPDDVAQETLIIRGAHRGQPARLWEELGGSRWFVSAAHDHFEIDSECW